MRILHGLAKYYTISGHRKPTNSEEHSTVISGRQQYRDQRFDGELDTSSKKNTKSQHKDHKDHHNMAIHKSFFKVKKW